MSQRNRMYERIKTLFSKTRLITPDSPLQTAAKMPAPRPPVEGTHPVPIVQPAAVSSPGGRQEFVKDTSRGCTMGFAYDQEKVISLEEATLPPLENALCVPLMVSGTTIGTIQADGSEAGWTPQEIEMVSAVAAQLARHLEHLRYQGKLEKPA
jgi:hypothetical protein